MKQQPSSTSASAPTRRLSELSVPLQVLVRLCQSLDYGQVLGLDIRDGEPIFNPPPTLVLDIRLDTDQGGRSELELSDFTLCDEVTRLIDRLEAIQTARIQRIEVRAGIPRRALIEAKLAETSQ
jgi:hypothetical protein